MLTKVASNIMRTTLDIDDPILKEVKVLHEQEGRSMGTIVTELLADALARRRMGRATRRSRFTWTSKPMGARVDLADTDAVYDVLGRDERRS